MWPFNTRKKQSFVWRALEDEQEIKRLVAEVNFYKARLRGIQDRAYKVHNGEAYYLIQGPNGRFKKMHLPYIR